jgi:hypothetical protein
MARQRVDFDLHVKVIYDLIERQCGTLSKAILEGTQNGIEAVADADKAVIDITFDTRGAEQYKPGAYLRIKDNGRGIPNRQEIDEFWKRFGTPHSEAEHKIWAQFRMGRGQIFSYGINRWRTHNFEMVVDIAKDKAAGVKPGFELDDSMPKVPGCDIEVELYSNPIGDGYSIEALKDEIRKQIEFMPGIIRFNGEQLNTPPKMLKWTYEDENAYYLFGVGHNLSIYNLGAYTMDMSVSRAGVTGVVVSKKMLIVNFARNSVQEDRCPVWAKIREVIQSQRVEKVRKAARRLNDNERTATLIDLRDGLQDYHAVQTLGLFKTSSDKVLKFSDILKNTLSWTFAPEGDRLADKWMQSGQALCINESVVKQLSYRGPRKDFFKWLVERCADWNVARQWEKVALLYRDYDDLESETGGNRSSTIIPHDKLTRLEKRIIKVLEKWHYLWGNRRILIGVSGCAALAWTNGSTYIALNREYLKRLHLSSGYDSAGDLIHTMFHEAAHDEDTSGTHYHGEEFYRRFHEITYRFEGDGDDYHYGCPLGVIGSFADMMRKTAQQETAFAVEQREKKAQERRDKKLRIKQVRAKIAARDSQPVAARTHIESVPADESESHAAPERPRHPKSRRRMPRGICD